MAQSSSECLCVGTGNETVHWRARLDPAEQATGFAPVQGEVHPALWSFMRVLPIVLPAFKPRTACLSHRMLPAVDPLGLHGDVCWGQWFTQQLMPGRSAS